MTNREMLTALAVNHLRHNNGNLKRTTRELVGLLSREQRADRRALLNVLVGDFLSRLPPKGSK